MRHRLAALLGLGLLVVLVLWLLPRAEHSGAAPEAATPPMPASAAADGTAPGAAPTASGGRNPEAASQLSPERLDLEQTSLRGSRFDGDLGFAQDAPVRPSLSLRQLFDYVLSLVGERSLEEIRAILAAELIRLGASPAQQGQALAWFERYVRYLAEVDRLAPALNGLDLPARLARLRELRQQWLGADMAEAFYALEEQYQQYTLERQALARDAELGTAERAAREQALFDALPESLREPIQAHRESEAALADAAAIEATVLDAAGRYAARRERFGEEAAARLELLDRERAAWQARVQAYQNERARISTQHREAAARQQALDAYLANHFDEAEQRRIRSLEAIGEL